MVCIHCGKGINEHEGDGKRCPPPNVNGTRWATVIHDQVEFTSCPDCYAIVRSENITKHAAFHEGAKEWFEHLLKGEPK